MRILFNHEIKNSLEMLEKMKDWGIISAINESNMEETWNFIFNDVEFYLQFDSSSLSNSMIYNYICESIAINNCEETEKDFEATKILAEKIKPFINDFFLETYE